MNLNVLSAAKKAVGDVGERVSGLQSFAGSQLKWAATGLAVVVASVWLVPLVRKLPLLNRLQSGGAVLAGVGLMVAAGLLAMLKFGVTQYLAAGLGIAGAISALSVLVGVVFAKVQNLVREVA